MYLGYAGGRRLPFSTVEDTFTVNLHKHDIKMEDTGIQGKGKRPLMF